MNKKKNIILTSILLIILFLITFVVYVIIDNKRTDYNNDIKDGYNDALYDEVIIDNINIVIEEIKYDGEFSDISLKLVNNTEGTIMYDFIKLIFKDKDNNIVGELLTYNTGEIESKNSTVLRTSIDIDVSNAVSVEYELIKGDKNE